MDLSNFTTEERQDLARFYTAMREFAIKHRAEKAAAEAAAEKAKDDPAPSKE